MLAWEHVLNISFQVQFSRYLVWWGGSFSALCLPHWRPNKYTCHCRTSVTVQSEACCLQRICASPKKLSSLNKSHWYNRQSIEGIGWRHSMFKVQQLRNVFKHRTCLIIWTHRQNKVPVFTGTRLPIGCPFFNHVRMGGGIPTASQAKVTGLLMVSTKCSSGGPSIRGATTSDSKTSFDFKGIFYRGLCTSPIDLSVSHTPSWNVCSPSGATQKWGCSLTLMSVCAIFHRLKHLFSSTLQRLY